jgi:nitroreductase
MAKSTSSVTGDFCNKIGHWQTTLMTAYCTAAGDTPFDCGAVATALVNAAWSRGLGAVINSQGIMQSPVVREHAGIADDQVIMKSIALGWPDETFPANAVVSERKSVEEATVFVGFEK